MIDQIKRELKENIDIIYKENCKKLVKKEDGTLELGVRTPIVRQISKKYFSQIKHLNKEQIFNLCEDLIREQYDEYLTIAFDWTFKIRNRFELEDFDGFEKWLKNDVRGWGKCDDLCTHIIVYMAGKFPEVIPRIKSWTASKNRWVRRAAAVGFIVSRSTYSIHRGTLDDVFWVANKLLLDEDYIVQKGYGWMLKAASDIDQRAVFDFVMKNKKVMPRTALRYAIEKMPQKMRKDAMVK